MDRHRGAQTISIKEEGTEVSETSGGLLSLALILWWVGAWGTHILVCLQDGSWGFLANMMTAVLAAVGDVARGDDEV